MSFRNKLAIFFLVAVVLPLGSLGVVMWSLVDSTEADKADARLAGHLVVAKNLASEAKLPATPIAVRIATDPAVGDALRSENSAALIRRLRTIERQERASRIAIVRNGKVLADTGEQDAVAPTMRDLFDESDHPLGTLYVATGRAQQLAQHAAAVTGLDAVVTVGGAVAGSTVPGAEGARIPASRGDVRVAGSDYRSGSIEPSPAGFAADPARLTLLEHKSILASKRASSQFWILLLIAGFFILAVTMAWFVARSLHRQLDEFLQAARRIGAGDFSARVPTVGNDDFAALGGEFNNMSAQLEARVDDLRIERERLRNAMQRIGAAISSNLDRDALLDVVVSAAADGVGAGAGRASVRGGTNEPLVTVARTGDVRVFGDALGRAESQVLDSEAPAEVSAGGEAAIALPLRSHDGATMAVLALARVGEPFSADERALVDYLAAQASTSIENVELHKEVEEQAVTDDLTGLANRRRFVERLSEEVERVRRFPEPLGLLLLDIDDFKRVNDRWGHLAGDAVLREVARVLRDNAREIDVAARYGGEELALVLPGADLDGAEQVAERVRIAIENLDLPVAADDGRALRVTVSVGVSALGEGPSDAPTLVAAADDALYLAKRSGKNRTERAEAPTGIRAE